MNDNGKQDASSVDEPILKKPYAPPVLVQWGTLRDITQSVGWNGRSDGGKGKHHRRTR
ncbi:lasso RiPP family leader peptide-containing protein [Reyranella sp.]|uniref:lasso RiPP family leader peptide-containing protein n=1 Tax=Reyranella sp. TaxID=1929291 RepID=UPI00120826C1|nr:lasso RiPP family leader peptide-containing protein [Reyranella sp.]TAJ86538.1 MAG: lasso RiPP family leader peptide-containing protein [Reyranella sp.]